MADVRPFRGVRYNTRSAGDLSTLLCPPFDVISEAERERLYAGSQFNVIRLEWGRDEPGDTPGNDWYARAAKLQSGIRGLVVRYCEFGPAFQTAHDHGRSS